MNGNLCLRQTARAVPAERAFGGDVHRVRRERQEALFNVIARAQRQTDFRIGDERHAVGIIRRRDHFDLAAHGLEFIHGVGKRSHHAVHLRLPGVRHQHDFDRQGRGLERAFGARRLRRLGFRAHGALFTTRGHGAQGAWLTCPRPLLDHSLTWP